MVSGPNLPDLENSAAPLKAALENLRLALTRRNGVTSRPLTQITRIPVDSLSTPASPAGKSLPEAFLLNVVESWGEVSRQLNAFLSTQRNVVERPAAPEAGLVGATDGRLARIERHLSRIATLLTQPPGILAFGEVSSPTVNVGSEIDLEMTVLDLQLRPQPFSFFIISQVEIVAPQLTAADAVRLRLYSRGTRRDPEDIAADFDGASHLTATWAATFSSRSIQYRDETQQNTVWLQIRNTSGNSAPSTFMVRLYGRPLLLGAP